MTEDGHPTPMDPHERKVLQDVKEHGWHVSLIMTTDKTPGWAFSIGMNTTLSHPEVVMFGLHPDVMHWVINEVGTRVRAGDMAQVDTMWNGLLQGHPCAFKPVLRKWYEPLLGWARWYYGNDEFDVVQCVWPDKAGRWPWDRELDAGTRMLQPLLYEEDPHRSGMTPILESLERGP